MVQAYVSHLRRALDGNGAAIATRGGGYELRLDGGDVDALRFERLVAGGQPREALALWRGDALADVADEPFAGPEIRRLEELRARAAERPSTPTWPRAGTRERDRRARRARGRAPAARAAARAADARAVPLRPPGGGARGVSRRARDARRPDRRRAGPELRRLHDAVLHQDPALDLARRAGPGAPPAAGRPPRRAARALAAAAALLAAAGLATLAAMRLGQPERLPWIDENAVGDDRPGRTAGSPSSMRSATVRRRWPPAAARCGPRTRSTGPSRGSTGARPRRDHPRGRRAGGARVRRRLAVGRRRVGRARSRRSTPARTGSSRSCRRATRPTRLATGVGALWVGVRGRRPRSGASTWPTPTRSPLDRAGGRADGARRRRRRDLGRERGGGHRHPARTARRARVAARSTSATGPAPSPRARAASGSSTGPTGRVSRIDPATDAVTWTVPVGADPAAIAAGDERRLGRRRRRRAAVSGSIPRRRRGADRIAVGSSAVRHRARPTGRCGRPPSHRRPATAAARCACSPRSPHRVPCRSTGSTEDAYSPNHGQVLSLAYDGLVGYRRVAGAAGATLVGALAHRRAAAQPTTGGPTSSRSVPGCATPTAAPVRPADFRASLERFLQVHARRPSRRSTRGSSALGGASAPARCDLSAGIETDDARAHDHCPSDPARTPSSCTSSRSSSRTSCRRTRRRRAPATGAPPGTGPVPRSPPGTAVRRAAGPQSRTSGLVARSRPAGFADRIEVTVRSPRDVGAQLAAVQRGDADVAVAGQPFRPLYPA